MRELYDTEVAYLQDLEIMVKMFLEPLRENNLVCENDIGKLFSTVEMLLPLHQDLQDQLSKSPCVAKLLDKSSKGDPKYSVGKSFIMMVNLNRKQKTQTVGINFCDILFNYFRANI